MFVRIGSILLIKQIYSCSSENNNLNPLLMLPVEGSVSKSANP